MAGINVTKDALDVRTSEAVLQLREAFGKVENVAKWLTNNPDPGAGQDPLILTFGYSADDAYLIRSVFQQLESIRTSNTALWDTARKLTGLE